MYCALYILPTNDGKAKSRGFKYMSSSDGDKHYLQNLVGETPCNMAT
jgi:hypothetical protein